MEFVNKFSVLLSGIVCFLASCSNGNEQKSFLDATVILNITRQDGTNFLDSVNMENIELYYKENGKLELFSPQDYTTSSMDYPKGYRIFEEPAGSRKIAIFCYVGKNQKKETYTEEETFIKWNDADMDTLSYDVHKYSTGSMSINFNTVKYNSTILTQNKENGIFFVVKK